MSVFFSLKEKPSQSRTGDVQRSESGAPPRHGAAGAGGAVRNNTVNYCPGNPRGCYTTKVTCGSDALLGAELPGQRSISVCSQGSAAVPPARLCSVRTWPCAAGSPAEAPAPAGSGGTPRLRNETSAVRRASQASTSALPLCPLPAKRCSQIQLATSTAMKTTVQPACSWDSRPVSPVGEPTF